MDVHGVLKIIVIESKRPCNPGLGLGTPSKRWVYHPWARRFPTPKLIAAARVKRFFRVQVMYDRTRIPDVITVANKNVVTPPRTGLGTVNNKG